VTIVAIHVIRVQPKVLTHMEQTTNTRAFYKINDDLGFFYPFLFQQMKCIVCYNVQKNVDPNSTYH
jgi:hypothetical protein